MAKNPVKILVVEDEAIVAEDICIRLEQLGYEIIAAVDSGQKAIDHCAQTLPDLVMMDINIKGDLDGIATAEIITKRHDVPVVFLTAYADQATLRRAKVVQPFGYITKPFQQNGLQMAVEIALQADEKEDEADEKEDETPQ